eukprot:NODE_1_length_95616_cov_0.657642.p67 type:complete len:141 gc:universal NODE_1_length_95616_cov_0.657642:82374-82796(+)
MFLQNGFHVHWKNDKQEINEPCLYFRVTEDVIFDPFEFPDCKTRGNFDLEMSKEEWNQKLDVWCPSQLESVHFSCRYQNAKGLCKLYQPLPSDCLVIPNEQLQDITYTIPVKNDAHASFVIYSTFSYFIFVSWLLISKMK